MKSEDYQRFLEANERLFNAIERSIAHVHKKTPPDERMKIVRSKFYTGKSMLEAPELTLKQCGFSNVDAFYFTLIRPTAQEYMKNRYGDRPRLNRVSIMADYLRGFFFGVNVECFYLVCLTQTGKLIRTILMQKGDQDSAPFYFRDVLHEAAICEAKAVVLCHNHPRGTLKPSREDLLCTLRILETVPATGILMIDHIIIAKKRAVSIRETGLLPEYLWKMQDEVSALSRKWLDQELITED